jgi:hypothetical protein
VGKCKECWGHPFHVVIIPKYGYKICSKCRNELPATIEYFKLRSDKPSGLNERCRLCTGGEYKKTPQDGYKICSKCKKELPATIEYFYLHKKPNILQSSCKKCHGEYANNNEERIKKYKSDYYIINKEKISEDNKIYREENKIPLAEKRKLWVGNNRSKIREYKNKRYHNDERFNLDYKMSNAIRKALRKNKAGRGWESLVGYTLDDLIRRLKKTMPEGYTWDDVFSGKLEIDHIVPRSLFDYDNSDQIAFKKCWTLDNLQLLPEKENREKRNKCDKPIQLYLPI